MSDLKARLDALQEDFDTLDNAAMLCTSFEKAISEAFAPNPTCAVCGMDTFPRGRSLLDGYRCCSEGEGRGNLFAAERRDIRRFITALVNAYAAGDLITRKERDTE